MKRVLSFLLAMLLVLSMVPNVFAETEKPGIDYDDINVKDFTYEIANGEATITGYTGNGGNITIPSTLGGYPVTTIARYVFSENDNLTSVNTGDSLTTIDLYVFQDCDNLTSVTFGKNVTTIGSYAFQDCDNLTAVTIPDSVTLVDSYAFLSCDDLTTVTVGEGNTAIESYAFHNCVHLTTVHFGKGLTGIGAFAFMNCPSLTDVYYNGSKSQWDAIVDPHCNEDLLNANIHFAEQDELPSGTCGENLTWTLDEEGTLTISGEGAMDNFEHNCAPWSDYYEQILSVSIGSGVTTIGDYAFYFLPKISTVTVPEGVTRIGVSAFESCYGLRSVTVPASVTEIGRNAFADNLCLSGIWVDENNAVYSSDEKGVLFNKDKTLLIQVPGEMSGTYTIPATVTAIENFAFEYSYVDAVVFPNGLKTIGRDAFNGCYNLTKVVLPNSVTEIGYRSFSNMEFLSQVTLSSGLTTIPEAAFYGNPLLTSVTIPEGVQTIGPAAFAGCATLTEVTIPVSVTSIGVYGFGSPNLAVVRYKGTKAQWDAIEFAESNEELLKAEIIFEGDHVHSYTKKVTKPTCTAKGYTTYTCSCGDSYKANETKALGHSYKSGSCVRCKYKPAGAKITTQPKNVAVSSGKTAKVSVKASGTGLKYVWYMAKKGSSKFTKTAVTTATYSVKMSSSVNGQKVYCQITDAYGNVIKSNTVTLYKGTPAKIKTQPKGITVANGKTGKLEIKASGSSLKYQWYVKYKGASSFTKVGKSSKTYSFKMASKLNGAQAYCVVKDKYGIEVKSAVVTIKMAAKPKVTTQPQSVLQVSGKKVKFSVKATGEGLKYQWYYAKKGSSSFKKVSGAKSATYSVKVSSSVNGRKYYCLVTDKYGQTVKSSAATLTMKTVAKITTQPKNVTVKSGKTAKFTVKAVGDGVDYVWFVRLPNTDWEVVTWGTNTLSFKTTKDMNGFLFMCCAVDKYENVAMSKEVKLKVK